MSVDVANVATVLHVLVNEDLVFSELSECINDDTEDDVEEHNDDDEEEWEFKNQFHVVFFSCAVDIW